MKYTSKLMEDASEFDSLLKYRDMLCSDIDLQLNLGINFKSKSFLWNFVKEIMHYEGISVSSDECVIKTIRMNDHRKAMESMAFRKVDYCDIVNQFWEESDFKSFLSKTFFFFIFTASKSVKSPIFKGVIKYRFSEAELMRACEVWEDTVDKIILGEFDSFLTEKETGDFFFKINARSVNDMSPTPDGGETVKRSFWLSKRFVNSYIIPRLELS